jgi:phage terminase large subunit-like protein
VTAFYNKYHTCSNCEDFEKNPQKWGFKQTEDPKVGNIVIQHDMQTGRAFHACIIVDIKEGKYYVNHAIRDRYFKNVEMKYVECLTFYEFVSLR